MKTFLISDTHFGHTNILNFKREDDTPLRVFDDVNHMNEVMINNWNKTVSPTDKIYHLGDVGFFNTTKFDEIFSRLNGTKILIKGNHDNLKASQYLRHFKDIRAGHILDGVLLAHIPVHPDSLKRWRGQIHGHLHDNIIADVRYRNICVEKTNYTPVDFEILRKYFDTISPGR